MPAFLVIKCRRGTREADPHSRRVPPKLGGALCPDWPEFSALITDPAARVSSSVPLTLCSDGMRRRDDGAIVWQSLSGLEAGEVSGQSGPGS